MYKYRKNITIIMTRNVFVNFSDNKNICLQTALTKMFHIYFMIVWTSNSCAISARLHRSWLTLGRAAS